ncbi:hypothetical protein C5167_007111 [Papaver somniferum]|uniref:Uncharacterized protein n=1 Tax=Papaver somniferum TaxID=3469 RepID=A0A4Y7JJ43_PAPSO|nr:hypothetical protein C5167_007111 [Papaver somniferum]
MEFEEEMEYQKNGEQGEHFNSETTGDFFFLDLFAVDECHKQGTLSIAGAIFKDKKGKWKRKHNNLTNTHAMNLKDKPNSLIEGQWKSLVKFWDSEAHQTLSKKNAISRSQQKTKHTMGRKNYSRYEDEMAQENEGNPPTDGDVFIKTHINKVSGKALDPFSQGYIAQLREKSGLDENGLDEDGNQQSISNEVYENVVLTNRHKRIRAQKFHLEYSRNDDFEREKEEREEEFKRQMKKRYAEWERRMEAQNEQYNMRQNQMMEYVKLCRPDLFTRTGQLSGPSDHLFRTGEHHHRLWEQLSIHGTTPFIPLEQLRDLESILEYHRSNVLDLRRVTGLGSSPADTGRRISYLWSSAKDLWSILAYQRSKLLDMQSRFTGLGSIPTDTRRRISYHWSSAKGLGSSLAELRSYSLDLRSRFTYPGTISTDLKMIVRREHEQTSGIGYLGRLGVDLTWTRPSLNY